MPDDETRETILSHLGALISKRNDALEPIGVRDYGSRGRNVSDASSDYDCMVVFVQDTVRHAIGTDTETFSWTVSEADSDLDAEIEFHGWSLSKFVGSDGIAGSNPMTLAFVASDEVYMHSKSEPFRLILEHGRTEFTPYALINHYRSLAASNYGKYIEQSWIREWSGEQFADYAGTQAGQTRIDEDRGTLTIGILGYDEHTIEIPLDEATAEGMIRRTTIDPTIKRHLNVAQALLRARFVEAEHDLPPFDANELLRWAAGRDWLPGDVYATIGDLISRKVDGDGESIIDDSSQSEIGESQPSQSDGEDDELHDWIETELDREITPDGHVDSSPDTEFLRSQARQIYENHA